MRQLQGCEEAVLIALLVGLCKYMYIILPSKVHRLTSYDT